MTMWWPKVPDTLQMRNAAGPARLLVTPCSLASLYLLLCDIMPSAICHDKQILPIIIKGTKETQVFLFDLGLPSNIFLRKMREWTRTFYHNKTLSYLRTWWNVKFSMTPLSKPGLPADQWPQLLVRGGAFMPAVLVKVLFSKPWTDWLSLFLFCFVLVFCLFVLLGLKRVVLGCGSWPPRQPAMIPTCCVHILMYYSPPTLYQG